MRSLAREAVYKYVFSRLFNQNDEGLFDILLKNDKLTPSDRDFAKQLLKCIDGKYEEYLSVIEKLTRGYKLDRVFAADKCALLIGMAEFDNFKNTDLPVIINEAVNLASKYSTEKSADFVNGILAKYVYGENDG